VLVLGISLLVGVGLAVVLAMATDLGPFGASMGVPLP
jgi:hypothetical protein